MNDAQAAILDLHAKKLTGARLARRLVAYGQWHVPVSAAEAGAIMQSHVLSRIRFNQTPAGEKRLLLFSDAKTYAQSLKASPEPATEKHFVTVPGTTAFQLPAADFTTILIDPQTPTAIVYEGSQLDYLRAIAAATVVEGQLALMRRGEGPDGTVRAAGEYGAYSIVLRNDDGKAAICYAPDDKGRKLIAVFTAQDACDAYMARIPTEIAMTLRQVKVNGLELFGALQREAADGIVFNCFGPANPVAFAMGLSAVVLGEMGGVK